MAPLALLLATVLPYTAAAAGCDFEAWAAEHGKSYHPAAERAARRAVFDTNCARFADLSVGGSAVFGVDEHSDLSPAEFSAALGSCSSSAPTPSEPAPAVKRSNFTFDAAADSIDWRAHGGKSYVTHVKNQGAFGTCWSFGVAENLEGLNVRQGNPLVNISEQEFISCCPGCQGRSEDITFDWLMNNTAGQPALEASYPYKGDPEDPCTFETAPRAPVKLHSWGRVLDDGTGGPVVAALQTKGPMGLGVNAKCFAGYKGGVISTCNATGGVDHAVLVVAAGTDAGVPYFTIKNSWGQKWGEGGYVRIAQGKTWWGPLNTIFTK